MSQMSTHYEPEFKKKIVRLHLEEGRILKVELSRKVQSKNSQILSSR